MKKLNIITIGCFALFVAFASCEKEGAPDPPINPEKPDSYIPSQGIESKEQDKIADARIAEINSKRYILEMESSLPNE